jgi:hypothetical protein
MANGLWIYAFKLCGMKHVEVLTGAIERAFGLSRRSGKRQLAPMIDRPLLEV